MPQLDRTIVFTQLFWLIATFCFLYGSLLHFILPVIVKTLKLRNNITELHSNTKNEIDSKWNIFYKNSLINFHNCLDVCKEWQFHRVNFFHSIKNDQKILDINFLNKIYLLIVYNTKYISIKDKPLSLFISKD